MKKIILLVLLACGMVGCEGLKTKPEDNIIGRKYHLCGYYDKNPFENKPESYVIVLQQIDGYVQYSWQEGHGQPTTITYSRRYNDFMWLVKNCQDWPKQ